ncbi:protein disulfide isomerase [Morganella morganii]|uniref:Thiol:disulfide interchange protein n=1 Tax=Morganella morganii TaxID=582 RepID=A0A0D8L2R2_MORMO|nr:protein disulfide isomerase [Morganella morganii]
MLLNLRFFFIINLVLFSTVASARTEAIKAGVQYQNLDNEVSGAPVVVEFFSFYCGPCYLFAETYNVDKTISGLLPKGVKLTKYHVGVMGELGEELTVAWSIAIALGLENQIEKKLFERQKANTLKNINDIKAVFSELGISSEQYDKMKQSKEIDELINKQNNAVKAFKVISTPSFYVLGKYKVRNSGIKDKTVEGYSKEFADIIVYLLDR